MNKTDIATRADIEKLIATFYEKVKQDDLLAIIFTEVVQVHWEEHTPIIVDFWQTVLLDADLYHKNAMEPHFAINQLYPLQHQHFERWLQLFFGTVDQFFEGPVAQLAKTRARGVAAIMEIKMNQINQPKP